VEQEWIIMSYDWTDVWKVERDICFLYHEVSHNPGILGDLAYGTIYNMRYWDFLDLDEFRMPDYEKTFIRTGCLVMIFAMLLDLIEGSGTYLKEQLPECRQAVARLTVTDANTRDLINALNVTFDAAQEGTGAFQGMDVIISWIKSTFVRGYFKEMSALNS
jgi:hypothetical protein